MNLLRLTAVVSFLLCTRAWAWEEQRVLEYVLTHNPVIRAHHGVTEKYRPPESLLDRLKEYTNAYGKAGVGGTDFLSGESEPYTLQAGVQLSIPLASTKERREYAIKYVEETRAMDEVRTAILGEMGSLRQNEADLEASETRLKFYADKSAWLQKRVDQGFSDSVELWDIGQKLHEERAVAQRLRTLTASARYQLASYAGEHWQELLKYLEGKGEIPD